jgi:hypothetical protein
MPKHPRREHRNCNQRRLTAAQPRDELGRGKLRDVEFKVTAHSIEQLARLINYLALQIDAFGFCLSQVERNHAVIQATAELQLNLPVWLRLSAGCASGNVYRGDYTDLLEELPTSKLHN